MELIPKTVWFFGLSGSGKTTLANSLAEKEQEKGIRTILLDGDIIRKGINQNLGFSKADRDENVRRIAEICKLMQQVGVRPIVAAITPYDDQRKSIKQILGEQNVILVHVSCPLEICEGRDPKNLYKLARSGKISNFTGISDNFERPATYDILVDTEMNTIRESLLDLEKQMDDLHHGINFHF